MQKVDAACLNGNTANLVRELLTATTLFTGRHPRHAPNQTATNVRQEARSQAGDDFRNFRNAACSPSTQSEEEHGRTPLRTRTRPDCHKSLLRLLDEAEV